MSDLKRAAEALRNDPVVASVDGQLRVVSPTITPDFRAAVAALLEAIDEEHRETHPKGDCWAWPVCQRANVVAAAVMAGAR